MAKEEKSLGEKAGDIMRLITKIVKDIDQVQLNKKDIKDVIDEAKILAELLKTVGRSELTEECTTVLVSQLQKGEFADAKGFLKWLPRKLLKLL